MSVIYLAIGAIYGAVGTLLYEQGEELLAGIWIVGSVCWIVAAVIRAEWR